MSDNANSTDTAEQLRQALAAKIDQAFATRKKPSWMRTETSRKNMLRKWEERYGSSFTERIGPFVDHRHRDDIPFDVLRSVEAMEPNFIFGLDRIAYFYFFPAYLRGMLLAPRELDVAFDTWLYYLLPFGDNEMRRSGQLRDIDELKLREGLRRDSKQLEHFMAEERAFIAEFFRHFAEMFPHERPSEHKRTLTIAENFWDGVYWEQQNADEPL